jgi:hypothetical protein
MTTETPTGARYQAGAQNIHLCTCGTHSVSHARLDDCATCLSWPKSMHDQLTISWPLETPRTLAPRGWAGEGLISL